MTSLRGCMPLPSAQRTKAALKSIGAAGKHLVTQIAIKGQVFGQSGTAGASDGQHGMSSGISDVIMAAAIALPSTAAVNGPATSPTIARIGSSLRSQVLTVMIQRMSQAQASGKAAGKTVVGPLGNIRVLSVISKARQVWHIPTMTDQAAVNAAKCGRAGADQGGSLQERDRVNRSRGAFN